MGGISISGHNGAVNQLGGLAVVAPQFDSFYVVYAEKVIYAHYFKRLGDGWHQSKQIPAVFHADGWEHGYDDDDVAHTPTLSRRPLHPMFGYW